MSNFHGNSKKRAFFEGWYLKHQNDKKSVALIIAFHIDNMGNKTASIQVVTDQGAVFIPYAADDFWADEDSFEVKIANNHFSEQGITLDIKADNISVRGTIEYGEFSPPKTDVMGPFHLLPNMQCNHGVLSFSHRLRGKLRINGEEIDFSDGTGYIEKDWGSSFPKSYLWTQINWQDNGDNCLMLSIADIPFMGTSFTGCICAIWYQGKEYRLATYKGVKIKKHTEDEVIISQGQILITDQPS